MQDDDLKIQVALLAQTVATLAKTIERIEASSNERVAKMEGNLKWVLLVLVAAVINEVLKSVGIGA
jgi:hypothetical protein